MKVTLMYESMFGNTEAIAEAVAHGLRDGHAEVSVWRTGAAVDHDLRDCDLLVLVAPTQALTLSRPASREDAVTRGAEPAHARSGLREWLDGLGRVPDGVELPLVAVLDTRIRSARHWPGSAARAAARRLRRRGYPVLQVDSFYVAGMRGPLLEGELGRARDLGRRLASAAPVSGRRRDAPA